MGFRLRCVCRAFVAVGSVGFHGWQRQYRYRSAGHGGVIERNGQVITRDWCPDSPYLRLSHCGLTCSLQLDESDGTKVTTPAECRASRKTRTRSGMFHSQLQVDPNFRVAKALEPGVKYPGSAFSMVHLRFKNCSLWS